MCIPTAERRDRGHRVVERGLLALNLVLLIARAHVESLGIGVSSWLLGIAHSGHSGKQAPMKVPCPFLPHLIRGTRGRNSRVPIPTSPAINRILWAGSRGNPGRAGTNPSSRGKLANQQDALGWPNQRRLSRDCDCLCGLSRSSRKNRQWRSRSSISLFARAGFSGELSTVSKLTLFNSVMLPGVQSGRVQVRFSWQRREPPGSI